MGDRAWMNNRNAEKRARGECYRCNSTNIYKANLCEKHYKLQLRYKEEQYDRAYKKVFAHYGARCACCGEAEPKFLTIDHINNDGSQDRSRRNKHKNFGGGNLAMWLVAHKFPPGYQILCMNCNLGKARNGGVCPHKVK